MIGSQQPLVPMGQALPADLGHDTSAQMLDNLMAQSHGAQPQEEADPRKLCILGLPWDTSEELLHSYFSQFGPLEEATIIRKAKTGESRGFGFVTYRNAADAQAVRFREHSVGGRHCDAKQALPRGTTNPSRTTRLFIGRVPPGVTDSEMREYFANFGKVQDAYIPKDPATGKQAHRGFGFVTFASPDDVDKVMSCAHSIHNQELAVQCAIPKDKTADLSGFGRAGTRWWQTTSADSYPSSADSCITAMVPTAGHGYFAPGSAVQLQPHFAGASAQIGTELGGQRLAADYRASGEYPRPYVIDEHINGSVSTSGRLPSGILGMRTGSSSGSLDPSHIERLGLGPGSTASNTASRRSSMELNVQRLGSNDSGHLATDQTMQALQGLTFGGSRDGIGIGLALLQARSQAANQAQGGMDASGRHGFPPLAQQQQQHHPQPFLSNLSGARPAQLNGASARQLATRQNYGARSMGSGPADANAGPRIFLGKLNKETTEQDVKDYFTRFGYVLDVYMPRDKIKRSEHRGFGFVTFETEAAVQRIAQHGPHQIKGSIIAIDSAVPRREEGPSSEDTDDRTPTAAAAAAAAAQAFNLAGYNRGGIISPTATAAASAALLNNGTSLGSPGSGNYGMNGLSSPGSGSSPPLPSHISVVSGGDHGSRRVSFDPSRPSMDQQIRNSLDSYAPVARHHSLDRVRDAYKQY